MRLFLGAVGLLLLGAVSAVAHEPILLDSRRATPGLHLELIELPSASPADTDRRYRLRASGLPVGAMFSVWTKDFGHSFHEIASGFAVDPSGTLLSVDADASVGRQRLDEVVIGPGPYPPGAIWEVALVSADRTLTAFAKVIPRPIVARDGSCTLSLQLVSHRGERFMASGDGFAPGDEVLIESRVAGRVSQKRQRVSADGRLRPDVLSHGGIGDGRSARYAVTGRTCAVAVEYEWGEPALTRR
jgi:hypothetical protein